MLGYMPAVLYSNESLEVKFADYNWYWVPLELLFYSSSSRVLVSRHPDSCIEEVVSFYCPQCLKRYMDDEVNRYRKHCPNCKVCPRCQSVLASIILTEDTMLLHCNYCSWECPADVKQMAVEGRGAVEREGGRGSAVGAVVGGGGGGEQKTEEAAMRALNVVSTDPKTWTWADADALYASLGSGNRVSTAEHRFASSSSSFSSSEEEEGYAGVVLRTKRTLRCRKDVEEGKMSILLQPKNFALEGDSSLKLQRGKWSVKDASAIYQVPHVKAKSITSDGRLELVIKNPIDDAIFVQLLPFIESLDGHGDGGNETVRAMLPRKNRGEISTAPLASPIIRLEGGEDILLVADDDSDEEDSSKFSKNNGEEWFVLQRKNTAVVLAPMDPNQGTMRLVMLVGEKEESLANAGTRYHFCITKRV